ncbi:MAG: molybdopterin-dependent oxidoreductase [Proteobacteria bacterium]|nr:molybdopterin-dependent oxidoreductase [Pseudomonadota bacterium]MBU1450572.1 molybdopterin-dependent oxidoreductase [Pseudomonadota bacterium]MBU2470739.1 molybdopterin-dependent oxidoreductase [Pseudomonadota bacterium]MBU2519542.1 molybdopterin-dependent oxidoreductase [Pseudomonadota bacterium]
MSLMSKLRMPAFSAGGRPILAESQWRLRVDGMAARPREYALDEIRAMPQSEVDARLTSVSGFSLRARWQGVLWRDFLAGLEPQAGASHATFTSQGGGYTTTVSLADLDHPRVMLVLGVEDEPLDPDYGGPLRMLVPQLWGYKSAKWLAGLTFGDKMLGGFWEDRGYTREGLIEPGVTLDLNSGERRAIRGGEVTEF